MPSIAAATAERCWMWDRLRFIAFLDIAAFHMRGAHAFAGVGLPLFLVLRFALLARGRAPTPCTEIVAGHVRRLLVPWVTWSSIFGALLLWSGMRHGLDPAQVFRTDMLLYGTYAHLWFLPFAAIAGVGVHLADRFTARISTRTLTIACVGCAATLFALPVPEGLPYPLPQWIFAAPSLPLGLLAGRLLARPGPQPSRRWLSLLALASLAMVAGLLAQRHGFATGANVSRYGLAVAALAVGALLPRTKDRWTPRLTPLLLGSYLLHPIVYQQTLMRLESATSFRAGSGLALALTVPLAFAAAALLRRTPLKAIL